MKILVITEEDEWYLPLAINRLLETCEHQIVEVVCAKNPLTPGKLSAARKFVKAFGLRPILSHGRRILQAKLLDALPWLKRTPRFYSVKNTCKFHHVPCIYCENINAPTFLQHCRDLHIDLIASVSPTQIFKADLINLPPHGCINIHTAKLPQYRGLYPVYWAMVHNEQALGISIHYIEKSIDTGRIILQEEMPIPPHTTLDHMLQTTKIKGTDLLVRAIKQINSGQAQPFRPEQESSYFSFPTPDSYKRFKSHGYRLW